MLKRRMLSGWGRLVWCGAVSRLILYIILYSYYIVSPSVRTVRSGSVVPAAAEGSNSHLQHTLHTPADASSRTLPAKCRGWSHHNIQYSARPAATAQQQQQKPGSRQSIWFNGREEGRRGARATGCCFKLPTKFRGTQFLERISSHILSVLSQASKLTQQIQKCESD